MYFMLIIFYKDVNQPSLPTPFYSVLVSISVFMALSTVFHPVNFPNNSPLSHSVFPVFFCLFGPFNYISLHGSLSQPRYNPLRLTELKAPTSKLTLDCRRQPEVHGSPKSTG